MKKILALTLALVMCVATFSACSSDEKIQSDIASSNNNKAEITSVSTTTSLKKETTFHITESGNTQSENKLIATQIKEGLATFEGEKPKTMRGVYKFTLNKEQSKIEYPTDLTDIDNYVPCLSYDNSLLYWQIVIAKIVEDNNINIDKGEIIISDKYDTSVTAGTIYVYYSDMTNSKSVGLAENSGSQPQSETIDDVYERELVDCEEAKLNENNRKTKALNKEIAGDLFFETKFSSISPCREYFDNDYLKPYAGTYFFSVEEVLNSEEPTNNNNNDDYAVNLLKYIFSLAINQLNQEGKYVLLNYGNQKIDFQITSGEIGVIINEYGKVEEVAFSDSKESELVQCSSKKYNTTATTTIDTVFNQ